MKISMVLIMQFMKRYFSTGPPVYFVVTDGLDLTEDTDQNLLCGGIHCDPYSVTKQIHIASRMPNMYVLNISITYSSDVVLFTDFIHFQNVYKQTFNIMD